jgi:glycosyltransferase involved in cell wall biosynthesis
MRILQVSTLYPPDLFSGGTIACHQIAATLQRRGHEVAVFAGSCLPGEAALAQRGWTWEGVPVTAVNVTSGYGQGMSNYRNASVADRFARFLSEFRPDVVHFHSMQALGADVLAVPRAHGAPAVWTMHDAWFACARQFMFVDRPGPRACPWKVDPVGCDCIPGFDFVGRRRFLDEALRDVDRVLAPSGAFVQVLRENGIAPDRVVVCENGLMPATPRPHVPSMRVRFGLLGVPDAHKGIGTVARAMHDLDSDVALIVYGLSPAEWKRHGGVWPEPRLVLRPRFTPAELPAILAELDVVLVPSLVLESFSIVTREALQYGVPVIASRCLGPEDVLRDGENGLLFDRGDAPALAEAMRRVAEDGSLRARLARNAAATQVRTIHEQVAQLEAIYGDLAASRNRAAPARPRSVLFVGGMDGAPFRYRVEHLVNALSGLGIPATARFHRDEEALSLAGTHEIVVLNRIPWDRFTARIVARAREAGAVLVFAVDDLVFEPDLEITALAGLDRSVVRDYRKGLRLFRKTLLACDAFLGSTEMLAEAAREAGKPAFVHPNTLSPELIRISAAARAAAAAERDRRPDRPLRIGYFSGSYAHDCDFAVVAGVLARVFKDHLGVQLVLGGHLQIPKVLLPYADRIERLPFVDWRELPVLLARVDVNLAPLETPSRFNDAKSALKWFEAAVAGVATIASPTAAFRAAVRNGENGLLASTEAEWESALRALLDDPALRRRVADAACVDALVHHSPDGAAERLAETMRAIGALASRAPTLLPPLTQADFNAFRAGGLAIGRAAMEPTGSVPGPAQVVSGALTARIRRGVVARQPFFVPQGVLHRIDLLVGTYGRIHQHDLQLRLLDLATGEVLSETAVPAEHACDNSWLAFELGEIPTRAGRQLEFEIAAPDAPSAGGLHLYCERANWPIGVGSAGRMRWINITYRTWMRSPSAATESSAEAARVAALERRLAVAEARLERERAARRTASWMSENPIARAAARIRDLADEPGPSVPYRIVKKAIAIATGDDAVAVSRRMEAFRASAPYRFGRAVYRKVKHS